MYVWGRDNSLRVNIKYSNKKKTVVKLEKNPYVFIALASRIDDKTSISSIYSTFPCNYS